MIGRLHRFEIRFRDSLRVGFCHWREVDMDWLGLECWLRCRERIGVGCCMDDFWVGIFKLIVSTSCDHFIGSEAASCRVCRKGAFMAQTYLMLSETYQE